MNKSSKRIIQYGMILFIIFSFLFIPGCHASELHVGNTYEYSAIQPAIQAARPNDTIYVYPGHYNESVDIYKPIQLIGIQQPIISFNGSDDIISLSADNCVIQGFIIQHTTNESFSGINIESDHNQIKNNIFQHIKGRAVYIFYSNDNKIINNTFFNNGISIIGNQKNWITTTISQNTINQYPLLFYANQHNTTVSNRITGQIILANCSSFTISHNTICNGGEGITLGYSDYNKIMRNNVSNNRIGIRVQYSNNNSVFQNKVSKNKFGLYITHSFNNSIFQNDVTNNTKYGCWICCNSKQNQLYRNNFSMNTQNAYDIFQNIWYNKGVGNYWSDYQGSDINNDGIGETPYEILPEYGESIDPYPIVSYEHLHSSSSQKNDSPAIGVILLLVFYCLIIYINRGNKKRKK